jgi:AraC-like DNA-binding protein
MKVVRTIEEWRILAIACHYDAVELAKLCSISVRHLQREFKQAFGTSPQVWLNEERLIAATERLKLGITVKGVAYELGFKQVSHFCRQFKAFKKVTASQFVSKSRIPKPRVADR